MKLTKLEIRVYLPAAGLKEETSLADGSYPEFNLYGILIGTLLTYFIPPVPLDHKTHLTIELYNEANAFHIFPQRKGERIYTVKETFPYDQFIAAKETDKKKLLLKYSCECTAKLFQIIDLSSKVTEIEKASKEILAANFQLTLPIAQGKKQNKNRTMAAVATAEYDLKHALIGVTIFNRDGTVLRRFDLFKAFPVSFIYTQLVKTAKWINNETFQLSNNSGEFSINIKYTGEVTVSYAPVGRDVEGIKEEIDFLILERIIAF